MLKTIGIIGAALVSAAAAVPAQAQYQGDRYDRGYASERSYDDRYDRRYDRREDRRAYRNGAYYRDGRGYGRNNYRCRSNGTAGTILGAIVGGLLGDAAVGRRGDDTAGAIVGAGAGALAGRAIERGSNRC
jgi:uncharacterized protein YcfJ